MSFEHNLKSSSCLICQKIRYVLRKISTIDDNSQFLSERELSESLIVN